MLPGALGGREGARGLTVPGRSPVQAEAAYREAGLALAQRIWDPLVDSLTDTRLVLLVPDGALHLVSFAGLPVGESEYLAERGPMVHYLSAERDLVVRTDGGSTGKGLLALGGATFGEAPAPSPTVRRGDRSGCGDLETISFLPLPATAREARAVAALWDAGGEKPNTSTHRILTGSAASEAALKTEAPGRRVLHLATHGFFTGPCTDPAGPAQTAGRDNPLLRSGLALAGANRRAAVGPDDEDGILTGEEIAALDLSGVEWAVLSACDTGVGEIKTGEGVFGLRRAFRMAGVATMIMSLWPVDDRGTRRWMQSLYEQRLEHGRPVPEAMRAANLEVLSERRRRGLDTHPFHWAGFVAAGDFRR